jgi:hypothetical protein
MGVLATRPLWCAPLHLVAASKLVYLLGAVLCSDMFLGRVRTRRTLQREAQAFIKLREEMTGSTHKNAPMSWQEFHKEMTAFMEHQKGKRGALLDSRWNPLLQAHKEL